MINEFKGKYRFLSNFSSAPIKVGNREYPTVEHYYQAMKTDSYLEQESIRLCSSPALAKKLGREVKIRKDWEEIKIIVMLRALRLKFENPTLREKLLSTGDQLLVEGNWWHDTYWGRCRCRICEGHGENKLGWLLMKVRKEIKNGKE